MYLGFLFCSFNTSTLKMDKAGRDWLQRLRGSAAPTQFIGMSQISRGWAGLVGGHTQVDFRTKLQGVGKLQVYKEAERKEIGTGVNRSQNRKWSNQGDNSMGTPGVRSGTDVPG